MGFRKGEDGKAFGQVLLSLGGEPGLAFTVDFHEIVEALLGVGAVVGVEKAFDQQEQKLDERKAWTASESGKRIQAIAMSLVHNLLRLFAAKLKSEEGIQDCKVITAWQKDLVKRVEKARAAGRSLPSNSTKPSSDSAPSCEPTFDG